MASGLLLSSSETKAATISLVPFFRGNVSTLAVIVAPGPRFLDENWKLSNRVIVHVNELVIRFIHELRYNCRIVQKSDELG